MAAPTTHREEPRTVAESKQDTTEAEPRPFATFLMETNKGRSHEELSLALQELVREVIRTGKAGSISYRVTVKPQPGNDQMVIVLDEIVRKVPRGERATSMFYVTDDNELVRNDPRQQSIFDMESSK